VRVSKNAANRIPLSDLRPPSPVLSLLTSEYCPLRPPAFGFSSLVTRHKPLVTAAWRTMTHNVIERRADPLYK